MNNIFTLTCHLAISRRDGWETLKVFFQETIPEEDAVPGAVIAISR